MRYLDNVVTLSFTRSKCIECMRCIEVCPRQVFVMKNTIKLDEKDKCIECGACQMNCPTGAITVDAGVGCASAIITSYLKKSKFLSRFIKNDCC
ncbi:MAG: 4Fe-4S binding protein [Clostridiales bacterium]|nr:4Fe-4S binding protein [Clostridiales bacterium]